MVVRCHPELLQIMVTIKNPQPKILYALEWNLPAIAGDAKITDDDMRKAEKLRLEFINNTDERLDRLYNIALEPFKRTGDDDVDVIILGINRESVTFDILRSREDLLGKKFLLGRGLAGLAMKTGAIQWYDKSKIKNKRGKGLQSPYTHIEYLTEAFDPDFVISVPIMYPFIQTNTRSGGEIYTKRMKYPVFAVINFLSSGESMFFLNLKEKIDTDQKDAVDKILEKLSDAIFKSLMEAKILEN